MFFSLRLRRCVNRFHTYAYPCMCVDGSVQLQQRRTGQSFTWLASAPTVASFRLLQWSEIVKMYQNKAAPQFKENFELARTRHHKLLEDPAALPEWLPELVRRTSKTGIRISSWFKFFEEDDYIETFGVSPLLSRVCELLLEDGMTKEKGLLVPKLKGQDLSHIDYCRDVEVFREYDHELLKTLLEPQSAMRELESVDVCHDAHKRFMRDHAQASLFVCVLIVM